MPLITRAQKGSKLTTSEMDGNLTYLEGLMQDVAKQVVAPASVNISLDIAERWHQPLTITGPTTITVTGGSIGNKASMMVIPNGTNTPAVVGSEEWGTTSGFLNTDKVPNRLDFEHNGVGVTHAWTRAFVPTAIASPPPPAVAPGAPTSFAAGTASSTAQPLTWAAPATGSPASYTYSIAYRVNGSGAFPSPQLTGLTGTSTTVTGLTAATPYDYQITATNTAGTGPAATLTAQSTAAAPGGGEDAMTTAYRSAMTTASQPVNETHVGYLNTFFAGLRSAGLHGKVTRLNLAMNDTLAATLVPQIGSTADTAQGTVTFDPAQGWATDGTSGRLNTGVNGTAGNWGMGGYLRTTQATENVARALLGTSSTTDNYRIVGNRTPGVAAGSANGAVSNLHGTLVGFAGVASGGLTAGSYTSIRRSTSNIELFRNGASLNLNTATTISGAADTATPVTVMALNTATGSANSYLAANSRVAGYWLIDGTMTAAEVATFYSLIQAFQTSMGRQV